MNLKGLSSQKGKLVTLKADHVQGGQRYYTPSLKQGRIHNTAFLDVVQLKIGARVMLVDNINTSDKLTNGSLGTVLAIENCSDDSVKYILIQFDNPKSGKALRENFHQQLCTKYSNPLLTPIGRVERKYTLSKKQNSASATATLYQFPIKLAFAATAHKLQGHTVPAPQQLVVDMTALRQPGQGYVMLSRIQNLEQLIILNELPIEKKSNPIMQLSRSFKE